MSSLSHQLRGELEEALMAVRKRQQAMMMFDPLPRSGGSVPVEARAASPILQTKPQAASAPPAQPSLQGIQSLIRRGRPAFFGAGPAADRGAGIGSTKALPPVRLPLPSPAGRSGADEDGWRRWRFGGGASVKGSPGSSAIGAAFDRPVSGSGPVPGSPPAGAAGVPAGAGGALRAKVGIASGSQIAVTKIASYAGGPARLGALMRYQSHGGELALEREDGSLVQGSHAVSAMARQWADEAPQRKPTDDVMRFVLWLDVQDKDYSDEDVAQHLSAGLAGHRFAYRAQEDGRGTLRIEVVASAAAQKLAGEKKGSRVFDNRKSLSALEERLVTAFGAYVNMDVFGFAHGVDGAARYLAQLTTGGSQPARAVQLDKNGAVTGFSSLEGHKDNLAEARSWNRDLRSQEQRDVAHIILSAKPGTDRDAFLDAARATLAREFAGHHYAFALHTNRAHIHVHAVVRMQPEMGERKHFRISDFRRWRHTLAEEARERNIDMVATHSRFEQANVPSYKLKDIRRVERGIAPDAVRRRVDAVMARAIHVPVREEGKIAAGSAANGWTEVERLVANGGGIAFAASATSVSTGGHIARPRHDVIVAMQRRTALAVKLIGKREQSGALIRAIADQNAQKRQSPGDDRAPHNRERIEPDTATGRPDKALNIPDNHQPQPAGRNPAQQKDVHDMVNLAKMRGAYDSIGKDLELLGKALPASGMDEFNIARRKLESDMRIALALQEEAEKLYGSFKDRNGRYAAATEHHDLGNYVVERRDETIVYRYRDDAGSAGNIAFSDNGSKVEIHDWGNREAVLSAMLLAADKWGELNVTGTRSYKTMVVSLAVEHGITITNPELQSKIEAESRRQGREADRRAGFTRAEGLDSEQQAKAKPGDETREVPALPGSDRSKPESGGPGNGKIDIADPYNEMVVLGALREANDKWGAVTLTGSDERFKQVALKLAAHNNIPIANRELQEQYRAEQILIARELAARPGLVDPQLVENEGREAWNRVLIANGQYAEAVGTDRQDEVGAEYRKVLDEVVRLARAGNNHLQEIADREPLFSREIELAEANERAMEKVRIQEEAIQRREAEKLQSANSNAKADVQDAAEASKTAQGQFVQRNDTGDREEERERREQAIEEREAKKPNHRSGITGVLVESGRAFYRPEDEDSTTPYADLKLDSGRTERLWGVSLPLVLSEVKPGDRITLKKDGTETVTKTIPVIDEKTGQKHFETRQVERNVWTVAVHEKHELKQQPEKPPPVKSYEEMTPMEKVDEIGRRARVARIESGKVNEDSEDHSENE